MKNVDNEIIEACKCSLSMVEASGKVGVHFNTFKKKAIRLGVYKPNQKGEGIIHKFNGGGIPLKDILEGKHPSYQTNKLRKRLIKEGIKKEECEECHIVDWNNKRVAFELEHIDGDRTNHKLENLKILCPNCHSQTETYRGKNTK